MGPTTWVFLLRFYIVFFNNPLTHKRQSAKLCLTTCTCLCVPGRTWQHRKSLHRGSITLVHISKLYIYVNKILSWFPLCQTSLCKALPVQWWPCQVVNCSFTLCICRLAACQTKQKKHNRKSQTNMAPLWKNHELYYGFTSALITCTSKNTLA